MFDCAHEIHHRSHVVVRQRAATRLFARLPTVLAATGLGRSAIYRLIADGTFPAPVRLGPRAVAWRWSDLDQWTRSRSDTH
jgi:prophage regulatory protein